VKTKQVGICWVTTPCHDVVGYQRFGGTCCLHLQGEVNNTSVPLKVVVFWFVTACSDVVGYHRFGGLCCLRLQGEVNMHAACSTETLVTYYITTRRHKPEHYDFKEHRSIYFTLKTKSAKSSETLRCHNPEDRAMIIHRRENLRSRTPKTNYRFIRAAL